MVTSEREEHIPDREDHYPNAGRVLVIIPTYNESDNVEMIIDRVRRAVPQAHILVADDNSPDGTGVIAGRIAGSDPHVHVLHRPGKAGLGAAYLAGFDWARENDFDVACEMDADGSHAPEQLHRLLDAVAHADVVLGSRYIPGGRIHADWPARRRFLSRGANTYTRLMLGMGIKDATGGYRAYRMPVLDKITPGWTPPQGYCFQIDLARRAVRAGFQVAEVPITFTDRERGQSKMSSSNIAEALWRVAAWGVRDRVRRPER